MVEVRFIKQAYQIVAVMTGTSWKQDIVSPAISFNFSFAQVKVLYIIGCRLVAHLFSRSRMVCLDPINASPVTTTHIPYQKLARGLEKRQTKTGWSGMPQIG
jgi:hypothetical protein